MGQQNLLGNVQIILKPNFVTGSGNVPGSRLVTRVPSAKFRRGKQINCRGLIFDDARRVETSAAVLPVCESWLTRTSAPPCVAGKVDEKATQLHAIASLKVLLDATKPHNGAATTSAANHITMAQRLEKEKNQETQLAGMQEQPNGVASGLEDSAAVDTVSRTLLLVKTGPE